MLLSSRFERQAAAAPVASLGISAAAKYSGAATNTYGSGAPNLTISTSSNQIGHRLLLKWDFYNANILQKWTS